MRNRLCRDSEQDELSNIPNENDPEEYIADKDGPGVEHTVPYITNSYNDKQR